MHAFSDNSEVVTTLNSLMEGEGEPLLVKLPRTAGRKDSEYMHLFSGPIDVEAHVSQAQAAAPAARTNSAALEARVEKLEAEVAELKARLGE